jgi:acyl-CoA synthetase (AMP-forming)/AMP-acid ligase II
VVSPSDPPPQATSLAEVLQWRAATTPEALAFCFLSDGEQPEPRLSYAALDRAARALAATLRDVSDIGDRAVLLFEPGLDFIVAFFACLYAGVVPVPAYPPRLDRLAQSWQGLGNLVGDCQPRLGLTTSELAPGLSRGIGNLSPGTAIRWIAIDQVDPSQAARWREPTLEPDAVALLQYTSGSTATPKGVMVTHRNLMHNERMIQAAAEHRGEGLGVSWLPLYHDMGLVGGILQAVFHGAPAVLMSPLAFLQRPLRWLQAISRHRADTSGGPNFAYDLCVQRVTAAEKAQLDLSKWSVAAIGSEPISAATIARFSEAFAPCGFRPEAFTPGYGLAESTFLVTSSAKNAPPVVRSFQGEHLEQGWAVASAPEPPTARTLVGCGRPPLDQKVIVVRPDFCRPCLDSAVGEIWVSGPSVAKGYWNRPEETARTFGARLADTDEGPFLRTGDLGFFQDGELFVTGRLKDVIIIRGQNHYPQDIEATVQAVHPALRGGCGAAFESGADGNARLVIVQEIDRRYRAPVDLAQLAGDIRQRVAERHQLQVHEVQFLEPGSLPKTSSGKVQRHACRAGYEGGILRRWRTR